MTAGPPSVITVVVGSVAVASSAVFVLVAARGVVSRRLSPKLYLFLINRALADLLCASTNVGCHLAGLTGVAPLTLSYFRYINDKIFLISFYAATMTLCALSGLKLVSILKPLIYRTKVTIFRCMLTLLLIWFMALFYILTLVGLFELLDCRAGPSSGCVTMVTWIKIVLTVTLICLYVANVMCYSLVTWKLAWRQQASSSRQSVRQDSGRQKTAFTHIWLNLVNFTACYMPYLVYQTTEAVAMATGGFPQTLLSKNCRYWAIFVCKNFMFFRIVIDNLIPFKTDRSFRRIALQQPPSQVWIQRTSTVYRGSIASVFEVSRAQDIRVRTAPRSIHNPATRTLQDCVSQMSNSGGRDMRRQQQKRTISLQAQPLTASSRIQLGPTYGRLLRHTDANYQLRSQRGTYLYKRSVDEREQTSR